VQKSTKGRGGGAQKKGVGHAWEKVYSGGEAGRREKGFFCWLLTHGCQSLSGWEIRMGFRRGKGGAGVGKSN